MEKEKKDKIKKILIFAFIVALLVLIHITNFKTFEALNEVYGVGIKVSM